MFPAHPHRRMRPHIRIHPVICVLLIALAAALAAGCEERVVSRSGWTNMFTDDELTGRDQATRRDSSDEGWKLFGGDSGTMESGDSAWSIVVATFEGPAHEANAEQQRGLAVSRTSSAAWWVQSGPDSSVLYYGKYPSAQDKQARADLAQVRRLMRDGIVPRDPNLGGALVPVNLSQPSGEIGELDLRSVPVRRSDEGEELVYTLQIGFYESRTRQEARDAAEQAARALRSEGVEAYYFHGPNLSMLTVGTFGEDGAMQDGQRFVYSQEVQDIQRDFPYNMVNGRQLLEMRGDRKVPQASFLIRIPRRR